MGGRTARKLERWEAQGILDYEGTATEAARVYGVSPQMASRIKRRSAWLCLDEPEIDRDALVEKAKDLFFLDGWTCQEIAELPDMPNYCAVRLWISDGRGLKAIGKARHHSRLTEDEIEEIFRLRSTGMTWVEIANAIGRTPATCSNAYRCA